MLVILSGLPGTGKTTIGRAVVQRTGAVHLRIDTIEQALRNTGLVVGSEGYAVAYAIAEDQLRAGHVVVADSVNPWPVTRAAWRDVAERAGTRAIEIEVACSNEAEHRRRVESRTSDIAGHRQPTWAEVVAHDYRPWTTARLVIDTAQLDVAESTQAILASAGLDVRATR
ncbi:MAG TPA: AAA family ATPase [Vicinamibacterales bacterium]|jgi:predicted kinase|nr:AAA family ATPase [Vicinamibacterales bacterium]